MTTERAVKDGVRGVDAPLTGEARKAERSVLVAAAVGLGVGVVVPAAWADYPWTTSERPPWLVWSVVLGPPAAAVIGAVLARSYRRGPLFWSTVSLAAIVTILSPPVLVWGGGSGAVVILVRRVVALRPRTTS